MKTFPKPLSPAEEAIYLTRFQEGDLEARNILIERNLRLVAHIVKKYQSQEGEAEDLISIGTIGLIKAVLTFDAAKGRRLATYAAKCIENELLMMLRTKKKLSKEVSLYEPLGINNEGDEISLFDICELESPDMAEAVSHKEDILLLYKHLHCLNAREQCVIIQRYGLYNRRPMPQREVARQLGLSRSYISRIEKNALQKLRQAFNS